MPQKSSIYIPTNRLIIIVGNYGSGKTEISVNLAISLAENHKKVCLADLDIVNPYFRSREAEKIMTDHSIEVVIPPGDQRFADLPIIVPRIKAMLTPADEEFSLFDVGGDDVGARMLSSLREALGDNPYCLLQVVNSRRPFTGTVEGCLKMKDMIEEASRLKVSGFIANSHLIDQTTAQVVLEGYNMTLEASRRSGIPLETVAIMENLTKDPALSEIKVPILKLTRNMLPPWSENRRIEHKKVLRSEQKSDSSKLHSKQLPAARVKPIFRP